MYFSLLKGAACYFSNPLRVGPSVHGPSLHTVHRISSSGSSSQRTNLILASPDALMVQAAASRRGRVRRRGPAGRSFHSWFFLLSLPFFFLTFWCVFLRNFFLIWILCSNCGFYDFFIIRRNNGHMLKFCCSLSIFLWRIREFGLLGFLQIVAHLRWGTPGLD